MYLRLLRRYGQIEGGHVLTDEQARRLRSVAKEEAAITALKKLMEDESIPRDIMQRAVNRL